MLLHSTRKSPALLLKYGPNSCMSGWMTLGILQRKYWEKMITSLCSSLIILIFLSFFKTRSLFSVFESSLLKNFQDMFLTVHFNTLLHCPSFRFYSSLCYAYYDYFFPCDFDVKILFMTSVWKSQLFVLYKDCWFVKSFFIQEVQN